MKYTDEQIKQILRIFDNGTCENLYWDVYENDIVFSINCSDFFYWGTADSEIIDPADIEMLQQAKEDCLALNQDGDCYFEDVFVCRKRNMRPQGAAYKHFPQFIRQLFDEAGPERTVDIMNPIERRKNA